MDILSKVLLMAMVLAFGAITINVLIIMLRIFERHKNDPVWDSDFKFALFIFVAGALLGGFGLWYLMIKPIPNWWVVIIGGLACGFLPAFTIYCVNKYVKYGLGL